MNEEIESLYASLGIKPDEPSAADAVSTLIKTIQSKLKSSIYGGKDGVITLPATIEGTYKNGKEIEKEIKDAYAAIYNKAKEMADESVSLTLKDIEDFQKQVNKFGKMTASKTGNDVIANARNNVNQMLSDYRGFVNELKGEVAKVQKVQTKQTQKAKAQQKAKTKKSNHYNISDEEINDAIEKENARQARIKAWRDKQVEQLSSRLDVRSSVIDAGKTSTYALNASEYSEYESQWARALAKAIKETYKTTIDKQWIDKEYKPKTGVNSRATSREEHLNYLSNAAFKDLSDLIDKVEKGDEDVTFDKIVEAIGVMRTIYEENGKDMATIAQAVTNATQSRYDDNPRRKNGGVNREEGTEKGVGPGHEQALVYQKTIHTILKKMLGEVNDLSEREKQVDKSATEIVKGTKKSKTKKTKNSAYERAKTEAKTSGTSEDVKRLAEEVKKTNNKDNKAEINKLNTSVRNVGANVKEGTKATNTQTTYDKMDNVKKDTDESKHRQVNEVNRDINKDIARSVKADEHTGFNTDAKADRLIELVEEILRVLKPKETKETAKKAFKALNGGEDIKLLGDGIKKSLGEIYQDAIKSGKTPEEAHKIIADESNRRKGKDSKSQEPVVSGSEPPEPPRKLTGDIPPPKPYENKVEKSNIYASPIKRTIRDTLQSFVNDLTGASKMYKETINASNEKQDEMAAERVRIWGMNNGRNPNDTGDIAAMRRVLELYRNNKASIEQNPELMQKIKLTEGVNIDTTELTKVFNKALSGNKMRNAQMGGSPIQQIFGAMRGFTFMPSIEKSRAQADGLNQILGNLNGALNSVLANIQMHETTLAGMEKAGDVKFDDNGYIVKGTSAAKKTLADLEESKYVLETIMADLLANEKIVKRTGNDYGQMVKQLSFTSPVLRDNNAILRNLNAGLDKNGKALKFQTRMAEILNYTFQLIGRSIGQWFKKILSMLNPLNIIKNTIKTITNWTKSAFQDFGSYDTKWQRTMNVIKINFQRAIKPAMEWIAQKLVNIIGFFNIISMKVQEAFGQVPVDLFDQAGANAEKMRRELEEAANVTAGFDELHDIGSDNSGANDLLGDIYKPQLSDEWKSMAEEIGDLFAGLIKGEKTVGEVFGRIFEMLLGLLGKIAKAIWDWFKQTSLGKWITEHWKGLLATLLALFLGWQLLKIFGPTILKMVGSAFGKLGKVLWSGLKGVGTKLWDLLGFTTFGKQMQVGFLQAFKGQGLIGAIKGGGATLGSVFAQAFLAVAGIAIAGISYATGFGMASNDASYNIGLMEAGGKEKDKKGSGGAYAVSAIGGAAGGALVGLAIGGPLGAAIGAGIGAIVGLITTTLAPAFEELEVAARNANNEMQKIEYYQGLVQGYSTEVSRLDELQKVLNDTLKLQTENVYKEGEQLGITKTRMNELVTAVQNGTFHTGMLSGAEIGLKDSLIALNDQQIKNKDATTKLEEAKRKLQKAEIDLAIAEDVAAGNFEMAAARISYAEAAMLYTEKEATDKRIQLYKEAGTEEAKYLLQDLTPQQRTKMAEINNLTESELASLAEKWRKSSDETKKAFLSGVDQDTQNQFEGQMNAIDSIIKEHQGFWQGVGDTLKEIFTFGIADTWTYNGEKKASAQYKSTYIPSAAVGMNYVPNDGLVYLHQGEAVIPKKYNQPYTPQDNTRLESSIDRLTRQVEQIGGIVNQGIKVQGQFVQRGSDLVATVEKANNRLSNNILNNKVYAR